MKFELNKALIIENQNVIDFDWTYINQFKEFNILNSTEQNPFWHGEGNVMNHTKAVCNEMINYINAINLYKTNKIEANILLFAALFHDIGKGTTTKIGDDGNWTSPNHAIVGEKLTRKLLWDSDFYKREAICSLVRNHMKPLYVYDVLYNDKNIKNTIRISEELFNTNIEQLIYLKTCDCYGSITEEPDNFVEKLIMFKQNSIELSCYNQSYKFIGPFEKFKYFYSDDIYPSHYNYDDTKFKVIIMCGLPGSGKDTYIKEYYPNMPTVCRDEIRIEIGLKGDKPMGNKQQENEVTLIAENRIKEYCRSKTDFIINATSLRKFYREKLIATMLPYNPYIIIVYVEAPSIEDNLKRRKGQIPEKVILNMQSSIDFPRSTECHELIIAKQYAK